MVKIILNKKQIKQLNSLMKENVTVDDQIELLIDGASGIGTSIIVRYVSCNLNIQDLDITDYTTW